MRAYPTVVVSHTPADSVMSVGSKTIPGSTVVAVAEQGSTEVSAVAPEVGAT